MGSDREMAESVSKDISVEYTPIACRTERLGSVGASATAIVRERQRRKREEGRWKERKPVIVCVLHPQLSLPLCDMPHIRRKVRVAVQ
jgi:hypothetical protein